MTSRQVIDAAFADFSTGTSVLVIAPWGPPKVVSASSYALSSGEQATSRTASGLVSTVPTLSPVSSRIFVHRDPSSSHGKPLICSAASAGRAFGRSAALLDIRALWQQSRMVVTFGVLSVSWRWSRLSSWARTAWKRPSARSSTSVGTMYCNHAGAVGSSDASALRCRPPWPE